MRMTYNRKDIEQRLDYLHGVIMFSVDCQEIIKALDEKIKLLKILYA